MIAIGPNIKYLAGAYWDFFDHNVPLTEMSLGEVLEVEGFRIAESIDRFLPYNMVNVREYPAAIIRLYLLLRPVWPLFGKQFLVVATKP